VGGAGGRGRAPPGGGQPHPSRLQVGLTRKKYFAVSAKTMYEM
jgi:hypothetical protein